MWSLIGTILYGLICQYSKICLYPVFLPAFRHLDWSKVIIGDNLLLIRSHIEAIQLYEKNNIIQFYSFEMPLALTIFKPIKRRGDLY